MYLFYGETRTPRQGAGGSEPKRRLRRIKRGERVRKQGVSRRAPSERDDYVSEVQGALSAAKICPSPPRRNTLMPLLLRAKSLVQTPLLSIDEIATLKSKLSLSYGNIWFSWPKSPFCKISFNLLCL